MEEEILFNQDYLKKLMQEGQNNRCADCGKSYILTLRLPKPSLGISESWHLHLPQVFWNS